MIDVRSVSQVKAHFAEVISTVHETRSPVVVTQNGNSSVVIVDHASYQETQQALKLLKILAIGRQQIAEGRGIPQETVFRDLRARLKARRQMAGA